MVFNSITFLIPVFRGNESLKARLLVASIRKFVSIDASIIVLIPPSIGDLSKETHLFFEETNVKVEVYKPRLFYRYSEPSLRNVDIAQTDISTELMCIMSPGYFFLEGFWEDLQSFNDTQIIAVPSNKRYMFDVNKIGNDNCIGDSIIKDNLVTLQNSQIDPGCVFFRTKSSLASQWSSVTARVAQNSRNDYTIKNASAIAINHIYLKSPNIAGILPKNWGVLPHNSSGARLIKYENIVSLIQSSIRMQDCTMEIYDDFLEIGVNIFGEISKVDLKLILKKG